MSSSSRRGMCGMNLPHDSVAEIYWAVPLKPLASADTYLCDLEPLECISGCCMQMLCFFEDELPWTELKVAQ